MRGTIRGAGAPCGRCSSGAGGTAPGCALLRERSAPARRAFLRAALALGAGLSLPPAALAEDDKHDPSALPPQLGDHFAYLPGDKEGEVKVADLAVGGPQVMAYPMDPKSRLVRDGSRLNMVILVRFDPAVLGAETRAHAAGGVVAYSAVCTHQGCPVSMWSTERKAVFCSCHGSIYDLKDGAHVLDGPAPRPLPALPVRIDNGAPAVAGNFTGRVGSQI